MIHLNLSHQACLFAYSRAEVFESVRSRNVPLTTQLKRLRTWLSGLSWRCAQFSPWCPAY